MSPFVENQSPVASVSRRESNLLPAPLARVLITGGTGFIGKHLLERFHRMNSDVRVAVRPGGRVRLPALSGLHVHEGPMSRADDWRRAVDGVDTVIHLAGATAGTRAELLQVNRDITRALSQACSENSNPPRLIYISSLSAAGPSDGTRHRAPSDRAQPVSNYGQTKLEGEWAALAFCDRVPVTILRPGIVFGSGDQELMRLVDSIARWGINPMAGFHDPRIGFVHIEDLIDAILAAAIHGRTCVGPEPHAEGGRGVYFVSDREFITLAEFAVLMAGGLGRKRVFHLRIPLPIVWSAAWMSEQAGRWMGRRSTFNPDKIREASCDGWTCDTESTERELSWRPAIQLAQRLHQFASMHGAR